MRLVENPGNMLDIRRAFAHVSTSALLENWNRIEVGTSNSFETLRAHALRTAFSEWALAVGHVHGLVCDAHDSDSSNAGPGAQESIGKENIPLALSLPLTLNTVPAERKSDEGTMDSRRIIVSKTSSNATRIIPSWCRGRALARLDSCAINHERGASSTTSHACAAPNPQDAIALSFISETGVGDRPAPPLPARGYSSGSSGHHAIAPTHSVSKEEVRCFHDRWTAGFVNRMDASHVIHPKVGRMLLSNGMALG